MLLITTIIYSFIQEGKSLLSGKQQRCIQMQTVSLLDDVLRGGRGGEKDAFFFFSPFAPRPPEMFLWILARICDASRAERSRRRMCDVGVCCSNAGCRKEKKEGVTSMKIQYNTCVMCRVRLI